MKKICALTQGETVPSTRFRIEQYVNSFHENGIDLAVFNAKKSAYPPLQKNKRPMWLLSELHHRIKQLNKINDFEGIILQRELVSTLYTVERFINKPCILDVDDAIFLYRNGRTANNLAQKSQHLVCGNQFLADYFSEYNNNITIIPTGVDIQRFVPDYSLASREIIWSGSSSGYAYLYSIESSLKVILDKNPDWCLKIVSDKTPTFKMLDSKQWNFVYWSPTNEVSTMQTAAIGLMPLEDSDWTRGKCSYKMLLYMACGLPVVVSAVGMNLEVMRKGNFGYSVKNNDEWINALQSLIDQESERLSMSVAAVETVRASYSIQECTQKWMNVFNKVFL